MTPERRMVEALLRPIRRVMRTMVQRAVLDSLDDGAGMQRLQVKLVGKNVRRAEHFQPAGLSASPSGGEGLAFATMGQGDHTVVLCLNNQAMRPQDGAVGDTQLYDEHGGEVHLSATGIELHQGGVTDFVGLAAKVLTELNDIRTRFDVHVHPTAAVGAPSVPTPVPGVIPMGAAGSVAAAKVKAE